MRTASKDETHCRHCGKAIEAKRQEEAIAIIHKTCNSNGVWEQLVNSNMAFHVSCYREIAGEQYMPDVPEDNIVDAEFVEMENDKPFRERISKVLGGLPTTGAGMLSRAQGKNLDALAETIGMKRA